MTQLHSLLQILILNVWSVDIKRHQLPILTGSSLLISLVDALFSVHATETLDIPFLYSHRKLAHIFASLHVLSHTCQGLWILWLDLLSLSVVSESDNYLNVIESTSERFLRRNLRIILCLTNWIENLKKNVTPSMAFLRHSCTSFWFEFWYYKREEN